MGKLDGEAGDWVRVAEPARSDGGAASWTTSVRIQQRGTRRSCTQCADQRRPLRPPGPQARKEAGISSPARRGCGRRPGTPAGSPVAPGEAGTAGALLSSRVHAPCGGAFRTASGPRSLYSHWASASSSVHITARTAFVRDLRPQ